LFEELNIQSIRQSGGTILFIDGPCYAHILNTVASAAFRKKLCQEIQQGLGIHQCQGVLSCRQCYQLYRHASNTLAVCLLLAVACISPDLLGRTPLLDPLARLVPRLHAIAFTFNDIGRYRRIMDSLRKVSGCARLTRGMGLVARLCDRPCEGCLLGCKVGLFGLTVPCRGH
jgi:hypothetical protein